MAAEYIDLTSEEFKRNPLPALARLRQAGPLVRLRLPMVGEVWAATTYESVTTILRDQETFVMEPRHAGRKWIGRLGFRAVHALPLALNDRTAS